MAEKEAKARIKINKLLEESYWRFFDTKNKPANIVLEQNVKINQNHFEALGENFEKTKNGYTDFTLLDEHSFPIAVLEAKSEDKHPLVGKEQARTYSKSLNVRYVILSNGNLHYFWDLDTENPQIITKFPTPESLGTRKKYVPNKNSLVKEKIESDGGRGNTMIYITKSGFEKLKIPLPILEIQKEIVSRIEEEQKLVDSNKKLIEIFENKVKDKIAEVWGE